MMELNYHKNENTFNKIKYSNKKHKNMENTLKIRVPQTFSLLSLQWYPIPTWESSSKSLVKYTYRKIIWIGIGTLQWIMMIVE